MPSGSHSRRRCGFCRRRIRNGDYSRIKTAAGGVLYYHHAEEGPGRNCAAAARKYATEHGLLVVLYANNPQEVRT
jgi:hypothetical protein